MQLRKPPLPALTVKLSKYNVDDVALGVCKTGAEEAGVTEVRTSLSEKKFEIGRASCRERVEISVVAVSIKKKTKKREASMSAEGRDTRQGVAIAGSRRASSMPV